MRFWGKFRVEMVGSGNISTKMNGSKKWNVIISLLGVEKMGEKIKDRFRKIKMGKNLSKNSELVKNW